MAQKELRARILSALRRTFRPELLNRIDDMIVFHPLTQENLTLIARRMILETVERARALNITLSIDDTVTQHFAERTHQEKDGARPLRRMIDSEITNQVADAYLCGRLSNGAAAQITVKNGEISLIH